MMGAVAFAVGVAVAVMVTMAVAFMVSRCLLLGQWKRPVGAMTTAVVVARVVAMSLVSAVCIVVRVAVGMTVPCEVLVAVNGQWQGWWWWRWRAVARAVVVWL